MKLAIFNTKGGVGKSTLAINLATLSKATLFDCDPQATCCYWSDRRTKKIPDVVDVNLGRVPSRMKGQDNIIIDLPGSAVGGIQAALEAVDFILVPITVDQFALDALASTRDLVFASKKPYALLINKLNPRASFAPVFEMFEEQEYIVCPYSFSAFKANEEWAADGLCAADKAQSRSGKEIKAIWKWVQKEVSNA